MIDINNEIKQAMLAKDSVSLAALRAVKSAFIVAQTEKDAKDLDEVGQQKIILKQLKQRKDAAAIYIAQSRQDLADDELAQLAVLEKFLPELMSANQIESVVNKVIKSIGASSMADMGKVMGKVNKQLEGKADGKLIAELVKKSLV